MVKTLKRFIMVLSVVVLVISFGIPLMMFPSKAYAEITIPAVGQEFQGGIVAYILNSTADKTAYVTGIRALIVAKEDFATIKWSNAAITVDGTSGPSLKIGTGQYNTNEVVKKNSAYNLNTYAAGVCDAYSVTDNSITYDDWFLPSSDEIVKIVQSSIGIYKLVSGTKYWSSSSSGSTNCGYQLGADTLWDTYDKTYSVRAVRYIKVDTINIDVIPGVTAPVTGATPVTAITATAQYTGTVAWSDSPATFAARTSYTATITLTAKTGYTLTGVAANFFKVDKVTSPTNSANLGVVTALFPATAADIGSGSSGSSPAPRVLTLDEWVVLNHSLDELLNQYGTSSTGFVKMLYDNCLLRRPDESGLNSWDEQLKNNVFGANFAVENFIFSDEIGAKVAAMTNDEYVTFLYSTLFNRIPDDTGYNDWLNYMNSGSSKEETLKEFLNSIEWISICNLFNITP